MGELLLALRQRLTDLQNAVFSHPCSDWEEYQNRLGRYKELVYLIGMIEGTNEEDV